MFGQIKIEGQFVFSILIFNMSSVKGLTVKKFSKRNK